MLQLLLLTARQRQALTELQDLSDSREHLKVAHKRGSNRLYDHNFEIAFAVRD